MSKNNWFHFSLKDREHLIFVRELLSRNQNGKVGCVFAMVVVYEEYGPNGHREDAPNFKISHSKEGYIGASWSIVVFNGVNDAKRVNYDIW